MEPVFSERIRVVPPIVEKATMAILVPTTIFILVSAALGWTEWWLFVVFTVITLFLFVLFRKFVLKTDVYEDKVVIKYYKVRSYRIEKILDTRYGVMNELRNYAGISFRDYKYRYYNCTGCVDGVLFRTKNTVVAVSSERAEELASVLPKAVNKNKTETEE
ncbi:MAG: hypothetical protein ACOX1N_04600 [Candidatus Methanomethylophilaceae archaeon]